MRTRRGFGAADIVMQAARGRQGLSCNHH